MASISSRRELGEEYAQQIESNPFAIDSNTDVFAAKSTAKKERIDRINFQKSTSITKRLDFTARNAMLSLREESPPELLSNAYTTPNRASRPPESSFKSSPLECDPEIAALAADKKADVLSYRAPAYTQKYADLYPADRDILDSLPRLGGAPEKLDVFLSKQKEIFLVELSLQTKQQQIDMLDSDVKRRESALQANESQYEREVEEFDKNVRQSDQQTIQSVLEQEQATRDRRAREEQISQTITQIYELESEISRNELALLKYCKYKDFMVELLAPTERSEFQANEARLAGQRRAIAISCQRFNSCDGLCLDCFTNVRNAGLQCLEPSELASDETEKLETESNSDIICDIEYNKGPFYSVDKCSHKHIIDYKSVENEEVRDFLLSQKPIRHSVELSLRAECDASTYSEYCNFPTLSPGLDDYAAVCIETFVKEPAGERFGSSFEFINTMRLIESNNFYLVENLQDADEQAEKQRQKLLYELRGEEQQIAQLQQQVQRLAQIGEGARKKAGESGDLTESEYNEQVAGIEQIDAIVKGGYELVVQAILDYLSANQAAQRLPAYQELADPQSLGALSMLSWMEGNLERIYSKLAGVDQRQRFVFERSRERARRKREEARRAADKELARQAKIQKTQERSKEPIRQCDVRDVKAPSYAQPKREIGEVVKQAADELREIGFYE